MTTQISSLPKKAQDRIDTLKNTIFIEDGLKHHNGGFVKCSVEEAYTGYNPVTGITSIVYDIWIMSGIQDDVKNNMSCRSLTQTWKYELHEFYSHDGKEYSWAFSLNGKFLDALNKREYDNDDCKVIKEYDEINENFCSPFVKIEGKE